MSYDSSEVACEDEKWEVEDAARTLIRAREIVKDKDLYAKVKEKLKCQAQCAIEAAQDDKLTAKIKKRLNKVFGDDK